MPGVPKINCDHLAHRVNANNHVACETECARLRSRCDELFHALACALAVPEPTSAKEQQILDWARSFMSPKMAHEIALVSLDKYIAAPNV